MGMKRVLKSVGISALHQSVRCAYTFSLSTQVCALLSPQEPCERCPPINAQARGVEKVKYNCHNDPHGAQAQFHFEFVPVVFPALNFQELETSSSDTT